MQFLYRGEDGDAVYYDQNGDMFYQYHENYETVIWRNDYSEEGIGVSHYKRSKPLIHKFNVNFARGFPCYSHLNTFYWIENGTFKTNSNGKFDKSITDDLFKDVAKLEPAKHGEFLTYGEHIITKTDGKKCEFTIRYNVVSRKWEVKLLN